MADASVLGPCPECGQDLDAGGNADCPICAAEPPLAVVLELEVREELLADISGGASSYNRAGDFQSRPPERTIEPARRGRALICGDCWSVIRSDQYEPPTRDASQDCSRCGAIASGQHLVSWSELDTPPLGPVPGLDTPASGPQTDEVRSTDCEHQHVERDDDGLARRFNVCLDCGAEVVLTEPDEDGQSFWEVIN